MKQILLVDDEPLIRVMLKTYLEKMFNVSIFQANSGQEAIELIQSGHSFDLIISADVMLNGTGQDLLDFLDREALVMPCILFCSYRGEESNSYNRTSGQLIAVFDKMNFRGLVEFIKLRMKDKI